MNLLTSTLAALVFLGLAGCGGSSASAPVRAEETMDEFEAKVAEIVEDDEKRQNIHLAVDEVRDAVRRTVEHRRAFAREIVELHQDYNTPRADIEAALRGNMQRRAEFRQELYAFRQLLIDNTTEDEWQALGRVRNEALAAAVAAMTAAPVEHAEEEGGS